MPDDSTVGSAYVEIRPDTKRFEQELAQKLRSMQGPFAAAMSGLSSVGSQAFTAIRTTAVSAATALGTMAAAGAVIGFKTASELETAALSFQILLGSAGAAGERITQLFEFAKKTPYETGEVIRASRLLQTFGGDALAASESLTLVGDAASGAGRPLDEVAFWVGRAYAAIQGGQPFGEARMRLQEMALLTPQAAKEMENLQAAGASASEVYAVLQGELGRFSGTMALLSDTMPGLTATISDMISLGAAQVFAGWFESAKELLRTLISIGDSAAGAALQQLATDIANMLNPLDTANAMLGDLMERLNASSIEGFAQRIVPAMAEFGNQLKEIAPLVGGLGVSIASMGARSIPILGGLAPAISPLIGIMGGLLVGTEAGRNALQSLGQAFANIAKDTGPAIMEALKTITEQGGRALAGLFEALAPAIEEVGRTLIPALSDAIQDLGPPVADIVIAIGELIAAVGPPLANALAGIISVASPLVSGVLGPLASVIGAIADVAEPLVPIITSLGAAFLVMKTVQGVQSIFQALPGMFETAALKAMYLKDAVSGIGSAAGAGGLAGSLSGMLNPAMLGITLATVGVTYAFQQWQQRKQEMKELTQSFTTAVKDESKAIDESAQAAARKQLEDRNQIDDLERIGVSYDLWTSAISGNVEAQQAVRRAMVESGEVFATSEATGKRWTDQARDQYIATGELASEYSFLDNTNDGLTESFNEQSAAMASAAETQLKSMVLTKELTSAEADAIVAKHTSAEGVTDWVAVMNEANGTTEAAKDSTNDLTSATQLYNDTIKALVDPLFNLERQTISYNESLSSMNAMAGTAAVSLDLTTEAGQRFRQEALSGAQGAIEYAHAIMESGGSAADAEAAMYAYVDSLKATLRQAGYTDAQIDQYVASLGLLPSNISTIVTADVSQAERELIRIRGLLQTVSQGSAANFRLIESGQSLGRLASGGPANAGTPYIVGEEGQELFVPDTDGIVLPADMTSQILGGAAGAAGGITINGPVTFGADMATSMRELDWWYETNRALSGAR